MMNGVQRDAPVFAILPQTEDFIWDDAEYFICENDASDSAFDWSVELNGVSVNIYQETEDGYSIIRQVWA
jgi:hypothetical protein